MFLHIIQRKICKKAELVDDGSSNNTHNAHMGSVSRFATSTYYGTVRTSFNTVTFVLVKSARKIQFFLQRRWGQEEFLLGTLCSEISYTFHWHMGQVTRVGFVQIRSCTDKHSHYYQNWELAVRYRQDISLWDYILVP